MIVMFATPKVVNDTNWYPNSGASNHVTFDATNLMTKAEYYGSDQVHIGNGMDLSIKHVGQSIFSSPYTSKILSLKQLLHVPTITKNLLSVSKFAHDNDVFFEFHSHSCFVKDQTFKTVLLEGKLKNGLYVLDYTQINFNKQLQPLLSSSKVPIPAPSIIAFHVPVLSHSCSLYDLWHNRWSLF